MKAPFQLVVVLVVLWGNCCAQHFRDSVIEITPGTYSPKEIIQILSQKGFSISYSQSALKLDTVNISSEKITVAEVLKMAFDLKKYEILEKEDKILIVPRKEKGLRGLMGTMGSTNITDYLQHSYSP